MQLFLIPECFVIVWHECRCEVKYVIVRSKFGQLGPGKGQFNSPHGFCLGMDEDIVVADTNNHRIQIFEKTGDFKYQFGQPGTLASLLSSCLLYDSVSSITVRESFVSTSGTTGDVHYEALSMRLSRTDSKEKTVWSIIFCFSWLKIHI